MQVLASYSEAGGATKTTTAVSLAMVAAEEGRDVVLVDLDPRAASTKWTGVEPTSKGLHVGAILADEDPAGWADELAVPCAWSPHLRVIPSARDVSLREGERADHAEVRLRASLEGLSADLVVIDCPNRQGGPLIQNALTAADSIVYAAKLDEDGLDGVDGAAATVARFHANRRRLGLDPSVHEAGIVVGAVRDVVMSRNARRALAELRTAYPGLVLHPLVPDRVIVGEARSAHAYYGAYPAGQPVHAAYQALAQQVIR
ncbi:ParA family protein [Aquipuribacter hungaricus]|uniref:ParA family protein n=1 Tax=Aquipuribacter hungaricus TaxID=545624 RepID=A0ABV7WLA7_9MICO